MSQPIRILQVFAQMNRGGAETMIMNLYQNIDRSKIQFDFIVHTDEKCAYDDEILKLGGRIFRVPAYCGKNHFSYIKVWKKFFEEHNEFKIIHGHVRSTASIYLKIAKKRGLTTIAHSHSTSSGKGLKAMYKDFLQYGIRYTADYFFACSKPAGEWLFGKEKLKKENFFILNNAIDIKKFIYNQELRSRKRKEFNIEDRFVIGHIGNFTIPKNHNFIIDIFKLIHEIKPKTVLMLVGDGSLRPSIERKIHSLGLMNHVILTGVRTDISELLQAMDIFVFPSLYEGLGIAVIEAQAAGLPCIISNKLPNEVMITNLVKKLSIHDPVDRWSEEVLRVSNGYVRENKFDEIFIAKYDVNDNVKWLERFYITQYGKSIIYS
ncbi:glycosyltransferase family 1 protein [Neobacillus citreus]|uniref:Glycosyltransferase family 1 protein n=1 Tax=Neobacillus citreus TaxID=2833578 RepID=A0A942T3N5_9BACI|nr:glycosyltransferase family 1 protein [Neobacillus citreus]MCH6266006.1 glycosyltransferase family 1 protein [Neobacillus citreus]